VKHTGWPIDQVEDHEATGYERVGDQPPMAAPPGGLGAHDRQVVTGFSPSLEIEQGAPERVRTHVRGVGREGRRPPRARDSTPRWRCAPTAQCLTPPLVAEPEQGQVGFEPLARQVRLPATKWVAAYVDDRCDARGSKQAGKVDCRSGSVADGPETVTWPRLGAGLRQWLADQRACGMFRTFDLRVSTTSALSPANTSFVIARAIPRT
jgi:hypothetical protein